MICVRQILNGFTDDFLIVTHFFSSEGLFSVIILNAFCFTYEVMMSMSPLIVSLFLVSLVLKLNIIMSVSLYCLEHIHIFKFFTWPFCGIHVLWIFYPSTTVHSDFFNPFDN